MMNYRAAKRGILVKVTALGGCWLETHDTVNSKAYSKPVGRLEFGDILVVLSDCDPPDLNQSPRSHEWVVVISTRGEVGCVATIFLAEV